MSRPACLLVTCCLEQSRAEILSHVIKNLHEQAPELVETLTVFDNASTVVGTHDVLRDSFSNVYVADRNVGFWSAVDWWLKHMSADPPTYTYIIESDMVHYAWNKVETCCQFLDAHSDVGSVRLHEYSVAERHLYNKDAPRPDSRSNLWQSHTNRVTGKPVEFLAHDGDVWETTFLTQLPALNRYEALCAAFKVLTSQGQFIEPQFQALYWQRYQKTAILDGGIFNCDLNPYGSKTLTGSWASEQELAKVGYRATRSAVIEPMSGYTVTKLV